MGCSCLKGNITVYMCFSLTSTTELLSNPHCESEFSMSALAVWGKDKKIWLFRLNSLGLLRFIQSIQPNFKSQYSLESSQTEVLQQELFRRSSTKQQSTIRKREQNCLETAAIPKPSSTAGTIDIMPVKPQSTSMSNAMIPLTDHSLWTIIHWPKHADQHTDQLLTSQSQLNHIFGPF